MMTTTQKVTRKVVEQYLEKNAPHLGAYENKMNGIKGVYKKDTGPAFSFSGLGKTWAEVLKYLKADDWN